MEYAMRMHLGSLPVRFLAVAVLVLGAAGFAGVDSFRRSAPPPPGGDLRDLFAEGWILQDRNDDDLIDFVDGVIVLPEEPSEADVVAAANIAARIGFETTALNPGLTVVGDREEGWDGAVILIDAVPGGSVPESSPLGPGWGQLQRIAPDGHFRAGGVRVSGYDATGLLASAEYLAGRYPNVWSVDGDAWGDVAEDLEGMYADGELRADSVHLQRIVVEVGNPGVRSARISVFLPGTSDLDQAIARVEGGGEPADSASDGPFEVPGLDRVDFEFLQADARSTTPVRSSDAGSAQAGSDPPGRQLPAFDLADIYSLDGLFRDSNQDFIPDRIDAYLSVSGGDGAEGISGFAERIGLESAGGRFPIAEVAGAREDPADAAFPIIVGVDHWQEGALREAGALNAGVQTEGEGAIEIVSEGFADDRNGMAITGADPEGLDAALDYIAWRAPYLWGYGKGEFLLEDARDEVRRFVQAVNGAGQTALALTKLDGWLARIDTVGPVDSLHVELAAEGAPAELEELIEERIRDRFPEATATAEVFNTGFGVGDTIFVQDIELPWEVDAARRVLREKVYPRVGGITSGRIEVRVSEPPEVRARMEQEIQAALESNDAMGAQIDVHVLSAYKQGYSWIVDEILPQLLGRPIGEIRITYRTLRDSEEVRWQSIAAETRWLQELYPVDGILARDLSIPDSAITFHPTNEEGAVYRIEVTDPAGAAILDDFFTPTYVVRPFFDLFPDYEQIRVTTGWVTAVLDEEVVADERIRTDPEAFWDLFQTDTYSQLLEYIMDVQDGRPSTQNAPFFDELRVDLALSEPNYRIGLDEQVISSIEALHEDIYFETLTFFDRIGAQWSGGSLDYAGRILPWLRPTAAPGPGSGRIVLTGKQRAVPRIELFHRPVDGEVQNRGYSLGTLPTGAPRLSGVVVRAGDEGLKRMLFEVEVSDSIDRYDEFRARSSESGIDRQFLSVELMQGMIDNLRRLHEGGFFRDAVAFDRVEETRIRFTLEDDTTGWDAMETVPRSSAPLSTVRPTLAAPDGWSWDGEEIVQWDTPIPPSESAELLAKLSTFPEVTPFWIGESFLGQDVWATDFLPPHESRYISQAKRNALKPTILLSGRQHANEVSSTSHILRLGEILATDPEARELLKKVNVVLHPITNPDGARLAVEMQLENPDFMLHAGYLGSLGVDATSGGGTDPIYPESKVRPKLREMWLPDVSLNLHGYPSHEWVQLFAGYSAWVQNRNGGQRSWWLPRGWFIPSFGWVEESEDADIHNAQFALLDTIAAAITSDPEVQAMNEAFYARYAKYGSQEVEGFTEYFHNGLLVNQSLRGRGAGNGANSSRVTYLNITTEAPDETARGDWLKLVATAGVAHTSALVRYLATGEYPVDVEADAFDGLVTRSSARVRPVLPIGTERVGDSGDGGDGAAGGGRGGRGGGRGGGG